MNQSLSEVIINQSNSLTTFDTQSKTALRGPSVNGCSGSFTLVRKKNLVIYLSRIIYRLDNVHYQNTAQMVKALTEAEIKFRVQVGMNSSLSAPFKFLANLKFKRSDKITGAIPKPCYLLEYYSWPHQLSSLIFKHEYVLLKA